MNLNNYLKEKGILKFEGHCQQVPEQVEILKNLASNENINNIFEIGFNAGHSAEIFLSCNSICDLYSLDIGRHDYLSIGKECIDKLFPDRHYLIIENSVNYLKDIDTKIKYDLIFIDGNHNYEFVIQDLLNCKKIAHKDTIVILDDTIFVDALLMHFNEGPTRAWNESIENGLIKEMGKRNFRRGRGMAWGKYVF